MRVKHLRLLAVAASALLPACAGVPSAPPRQPALEGDNSVHAIAKTDVLHYQLALGQISTGAVPRDHPAPIYPSSLRDTQLPPQDVSARLMVDAAGKVSEVLIDGDELAGPQRKLFDAAVRAAVLQWTFEPLRISQWTADASGNTHEVGSDAHPFSVDYVFRFTRKDGKPEVEAVAGRQP